MSIYCAGIQIFVETLWNELNLKAIEQLILNVVLFTNFLMLFKYVILTFKSEGHRSDIFINWFYYASQPGSDI